MSEEKTKKPVDESGSTAVGALWVFIGWTAFVAVVLIAPGEKGTSSYRQSHGGLLWGNILIFLLLFLRKHELSSMVRAARRVLRWPFSSTLSDYDDLCMVLCVIGAAITTIFVLDVGAASLVAVRTGIVIFLISLKVAYDRWRASKRKR